MVDRRNMKCHLVAPVVPIAVTVSSEAGDEELRDSRNVSEFEAAKIPVLGGAREVNRSTQPTESERRRHGLCHLPHVLWCTICYRARTIDDAHHVVIHAALMKVQSDAEQSIEHLLKAVKSICTADLIVQRAPVKSRQSQGHVERGVRLVENQYRALLFDVQERTRVEIDPISAASAWILRHAVWLLRYQPYKGGATSFERLTGSPYRSPILPLFAMVECLIPSDRKTWRNSDTTNISINVGWSHRGKR